MVRTLTIERRAFGRTGVMVSPIGLGTAELGILGISQPQCDHVLNGIIDAGINLIDTADCYGAEEKVGKAVSHRRDEFILITKGGHRVPESGCPDWSAGAIRFSIERSLLRLNTDVLDVFLLHSCPMECLKNENMIQCLIDEKRKGLIRFIGYSGDGEALRTALSMNVFDCVEVSVNLCDQQAIDTLLPLAIEKNMGVTAKRSLANACWQDLENFNPFYKSYAQPYAQRLEIMGLSPQAIGFDGSWVELALRFTVWQANVHSAIVGSKDLQHIYDDIEMIERGPLPENVFTAIRELWKQHDDGTWVGQI